MNAAFRTKLSETSTVSNAGSKLDQATRSPAGREFAPCVPVCDLEMNPDALVARSEGPDGSTHCRLMVRRARAS